MPFTNWKRRRLDKTPASSISKGANKLALELHSIVVLAEISNPTQLDEVTSFVTKKEKEGKVVDCLLTSNIKGLESPNLISPKEVSWTGEPTGEKVDEFLQKEYDVLYSPNDSISIPTEYLLKRCKAKIKTGVYNEQTIQYLDISVDNEKGSFTQRFVEMDAVLTKLIGHG